MYHPHHAFPNTQYLPAQVRQPARPTLPSHHPVIPAGSTFGSAEPNFVPREYAGTVEDIERIVADLPPVQKKRTWDILYSQWLNADLKCYGVCLFIISSRFQISSFESRVHVPFYVSVCVGPPRRCYVHGLSHVL